MPKHADDARATHVDDIPFPDMPETPEPLWAVHVEGPDDVIAAADRAEADLRAKQINAAYETFTKREDHSADLDPRWHANVIEWPYSPADHAEEVARGDERWNG